MVKDCFANVSNRLLAERLTTLSTTDAICDSCRRSVYRFKSSHERPTPTSIGLFGASGKRRDYYIRAMRQEKAISGPTATNDQPGRSSGNYLRRSLACRRCLASLLIITILYFPHLYTASHSAYTLTDLPVKVLNLILSYLPPADLSACTLTCHALKTVATDPENSSCRQHIQPLTSCEWTNASRQGEFSEQSTFFTTPPSQIDEKEGIAQKNLAQKLQSALTQNSQLRDELQTVNEKLIKVQVELDLARKALADLTQAPSQPVTAHQSAIFKSIARQYLHKNRSGIIELKNAHGRPLVLAHVTRPDKGSEAAAPRTVRERSRQLESLTALTSSRPTDLRTAMLTQHADMIRRNTSTFIAASQMAGMKVMAKFSTTEATALKSLMPWTMFQTLKRTLQSKFGYDVVGTTSSVRQEVQEHSFDYEYGTFEVLENDARKTCHFIRVQDVRDVIVSSIKALHRNDQLHPYSNFPRQRLWLLLTGDKGGQSTKLVLAFLNAQKQHSVKTARLLAMFHGVKDDRNAVVTVFQPIYNAVTEVLKEVEQLQLPCAPLPPLLKERRGQKRKHHQRQAAARRRRRKKQGMLGHKALKEMIGTVDTANVTVSSSCRCCQRFTSQLLQNMEERKEEEEKDMFTEGHLSYGGDWDYLSTLAGTSGPNGLHFCNLCNVTLHQLQEGHAHSPVVFPRYRQFAPLSVSLRTGEEMQRHYEAFVATGARSAKEQQNCQHSPLLGPGKIIEQMSCMPLHISLGLGLYTLQLTEREAISFDHQIKQDRGHCGGRLETIIKQEKDLSEKADQLITELGSLDEEAGTINLQLTSLQQNHSDHFTRPLKGTRAARESRKTAVELKRKMKATTTKAKEIGGELKKVEHELAETVKLIEAEKGPIQTRLDAILQGLDLKRQVYHKGALIGKDVDKLMQQENYERIAKLFRPQQICQKSYGSFALQQKILTLFKKLAQCYTLYGPSRELCRHEVEILALRCYSYGNWFPVNFPQAKLKRKFHILTVHVPQKARLCRTVGMEAEHVSESIHPMCAKFERAAATVQNMEQRMHYIMQATWLQSDVDIPDLNQPSRRK